MEFIVSEWVQVNPDNSWAMSVLKVLLFKLNTLQKKWSNFESAKNMVYWEWCVEFTPRLLHHNNDIKEVVCHNPVSRGTN